MCIFYPCTKILRTQKFAKQALFTTAKEIIHDINSPLIRYHTDIEYITTFLRHTCVSSSDRHGIFNFSYEPHENVAVIHFLQKITHFVHILQLDRQLYAPKTLHETPLISFCPNFHSLDIASAIMYGRHLEYRISQSLRNLTHSHHTTRATGDESGGTYCGYGAPRWTIIDKPYIFIIKTKNIRPIANIEREIKKYNSKHANVMRNSQI